MLRRVMPKSPPYTNQKVFNFHRQPNVRNFRATKFKSAVDIRVNGAKFIRYEPLSRFMHHGLRAK